MRYFLIVLSILVIACKKDNSLSGTNAYERVDSKNAFSVKVEGDSSPMRKKILNSFVEEKFASNNLDFAIKPHDELANYKMSQKEFDDYTEKEKNMSKLIVSFSDHLEVYFLPDKFPLNMAASKLSLQVEPGRVFRWSKHDSAYAFPGGKFFLASVSADDLVQNDQNFYQEVQNVDASFSGKTFKLSPGQVLESSVQYDLYAQKDAITVINEPLNYCQYNQNDPGCGVCSYKIQTMVDEYEKIALPRIDDIRLTAKVDDSSLMAADLNVEMVSENKFKFKISSDHDHATLVVLSVGRYFDSFTKQVVGFEYNHSCANPDRRSTLILQRKLKISSQIKIMGRGYEALKSVL